MRRMKKMLAFFLALMTAFGSTSLPVQADSIPEHVHNSEGWECVYNEPETETICSHVHDEGCYVDGDPVLICEVLEHMHTNSCYRSAEPILACGNKDPEHEHTDACYEIPEPELMCQETEHQHDAECYVPGEKELDCRHVCGDAYMEAAKAGYWDCKSIVDVFEYDVKESHDGQNDNELPKVSEKEPDNLHEGMPENQDGNGPIVGGQAVNSHARAKYSYFDTRLDYSLSFFCSEGKHSIAASIFIPASWGDGGIAAQADVSYSISRTSTPDRYLVTFAAKCTKGSMTGKTLTTGAYFNCKRCDYDGASKSKSIQISFRTFDINTQSVLFYGYSSDSNVHAHNTNKQDVWAKLPNCVNDGIAYFTCDCGRSTVKTEKAVQGTKLGHAFPDVWNDDCADHEDESCETHSRTCTRCDGSLTGGTENDGHVYGPWTTIIEAWPGSEGLRKAICTASGCGHIKTEAIEALPAGPDDDGSGITVTKTRTSISGNPDLTVAGLGDTIEWGITVTNHSNVEKTVTLTDMLNGASLNKEQVTLAAGGSETVKAVYTVKSSDVGKTIWNTVVASTGEPGEKENPEATDEGTEIKPNERIYTLTYDANGGMIRLDEDGPVGASSYPVKSVQDSCTFTVKTPPEESTGFDPSRDGHTLAGWSETRDGEVQYRADDEVILTKDAPEKTIYAVWQKNPDPVRTFKILYYNEHGAGWMPVEESEEKGFHNMPEYQTDEGVTELPHAMTISDKVPTREGYRFLHWNHGNKMYSPGDTIILPSVPDYNLGMFEAFTEISADLYAEWEELDASEQTVVLNVRFMNDKMAGSDKVPAMANVPKDYVLEYSHTDADGYHYGELHYEDAVLGLDNGYPMLTWPAFKVKVYEGQPVYITLNERNYGLVGDDADQFLWSRSVCSDGGKVEEVTGQVKVAYAAYDRNLRTTVSNYYRQPDVPLWTIRWMFGYDDILIKTEMNDSSDVPMDWYPSDPIRDGFSFAGWGAPAVDEGSRTVTITAWWEPEHVHVWTMETEPDCIHPGREACSCGSSRETDPLEHDFTDTAWKDGHEGGHTDGCDSTHHVRACSRCGGTLEDGNEVQKAGHRYSEWKTIKEATDTEEGLRERHCLDCEHEEKEAVPIIHEQKPEPSPGSEQKPEPSPGSEQTPEPSPGPEQTPEPRPEPEQTPEPGQDIKEPEQESGLAVIEDDETPLADVPQTGDPYPCLLTLFISGLGLAFMAIRNRRKRSGR